MITISTLEKWITWEWFDSKEHMNETHEEHIWGQMKDGCTSGELVEETKNGEMVRGWWKQK